MIDDFYLSTDPPYEGTVRYQNGISYKDLWNYIKESLYKIYISSYDSSFKEVASFEYRSTLSATTNNKVIKRLYFNKE
jgi:hypothetical protein